MIDFEKTVTNALNRTIAKRYLLKLDEKDIVEIRFDEFCLKLYYSRYEYELNICYYFTQSEIHANLDGILVALGCNKEDIPRFLFMSDETIMEKYLREYLNLINIFFDQLCDTRLIKKIILDHKLLPDYYYQQRDIEKFRKTKN